MKKILSICTLFTVLLISSCLSGTDPVLEGSQSPDNPQALRVGDFIVVDKEVDHSSGKKTRTVSWNFTQKSMW